MLCVCIEFNSSSRALFLVVLRVEWCECVVGKVGPGFEPGSIHSVFDYSSYRNSLMCSIFTVVSLFNLFHFLI